MRGLCLLPRRQVLNQRAVLLRIDLYLLWKAHKRLSGYAAWRSSSHWLMSASTQATQSTDPWPIFNGRGKVPALIMAYMLDSHSLVRLSTSSRLSRFKSGEGIRNSITKQSYLTFWRIQGKSLKPKWNLTTLRGKWALHFKDAVARGKQESKKKNSGLHQHNASTRWNIQQEA